MSTILKQGVAATVHLAGSLINKSTGARLTTSATARVCIDGTWGNGAGTLAVEETDQWKYTLHSSEAAAKELTIAVDHADAVDPIVESFTLWPAVVYEAFMATDAPGYVTDQPVDAVKIAGVEAETKLRSILSTLRQLVFSS